jgi:hypothetical protein
MVHALNASSLAPISVPRPQVSHSCLGLGIPDATTRRDVMSPWLCTATCCGERVELTDELLSVPGCVEDLGESAPRDKHPQAVQLISAGARASGGALPIAALLPSIDRTL